MKHGDVVVSCAMLVHMLTELLLGSCIMKWGERTNIILGHCDTETN